MNALTIIDSINVFRVIERAIIHVRYVAAV